MSSPVSEIQRTTMNEPIYYLMLKDLVAFAGGCITLLIAGIGAWAAINEWQVSNKEKSRELAWRKVAKARELVDDLLESDNSDEEYYAWDAMKMLDYQGKEAKSGRQRAPFKTKKIGGKPFKVTSKEIKNALTPNDKDEAEEANLYVR